MRLCAVVVLILPIAALLSAQAIPPDSIRDKEIGWMEVYSLAKPAPPATVDHRHYSAAQMAIAQQLRSWMQATYVPKGGLGNAVLTASEKLGPYNQNTAALPQLFGAYARIYTDLKYGANQKIERASNSHIVWAVTANGFMGEPADAISTPQRYYFTLPTMAQQYFGGEVQDQQFDLSGHPVLRRFPSWMQRNSVNGNRKFILIAKDYQLPFRPLTRGEYLEVIEAAVIRLSDEERKKLLSDTNKRFIEAALPDLEKRHATRLSVLAANKARYKDRLKEIAEISTIAPDGRLENISDVFDGSGGSSMRVKVYTIDPVLVEQAKTPEPAWILVGWTAEFNDPASRHLHDAVITKFNFNYVYDYFFAPEKVKGIPYTPLR